jgi:hypothetical protein
MSSIDPRTPRVRRGFTFIALAAVLSLSAVGLTQCRLMDDSVTGVDVKSTTNYQNSSKSNKSKEKCLKQCVKDFKKCLKDRDNSCKNRKRNCDKLPKRNRDGCKKNESDRRKGRLLECLRDLHSCEKACRYREGSGGGGR